jgi:hypothetical protein
MKYVLTMKKITLLLLLTLCFSVAKAQDETKVTLIKNVNIWTGESAAVIAADVLIENILPNDNLKILMKDGEVLKNSLK